MDLLAHQQDRVIRAKNGVVPSSVLDVGLEVIGQADFIKESDLGFQPVDMFLLVLQDMHEQIPADEIAVAFSIRDGLFQGGQ